MPGVLPAESPMWTKENQMHKIAQALLASLIIASLLSGCVVTPRETTEAAPSAAPVASVSLTTTSAAGSSAASVTGAPAVATNYEVASGVFACTLQTQLCSFFAEPGKLLVGPEFEQAKIDSADGAIERFSPANQYVLRGVQDEGNCPEGGFCHFSLGGGTIAFEGKEPVIVLPFQRGVNYLVYVRGMYADASQDTDLNTTATVIGFKAGHALFSRYPGEPNGGFISQGQLEQTVELAHSDATNCGSKGCSSVYVVVLDLNTGAWAIALHTGGVYSLIDTNM